MNTKVVVALLGALTLASAPVAAQQPAEGKFMVRLRALSLTPADKSDAIPSLSVAADAITVSKKIFPEVDVSYFFTKNVAAELVLTYPQQHDVELNGAKIGTFKHLPPSLLLQYHFLPEGVFRPYIGAGANLTLISSVDIKVANVGALDLESSSVGVAGQLGADIKVGAKHFLNIDIKKVTIGSDVTKGGTKVSAVKVDPLLLSVGFGIRF
ncbi:MAG: OmpW family protein [Gemmatimonadaceae bacterium]|nr:OmpW family protein [Gemmatimonadaceae bacterium]